MTVTRLAGLFSLPAIAAVLMTPTTFGQADDQSQGENKQATTNPPIVERAIEEAQREAIGGGDPARSVSRESLDLGRLRPAKAAEVLQLVDALVAEQILNGMEHGTGMRFDGDAVFRPQDVEVEGRHQGYQRRRRRLVAADFETITAIDFVIGVMDQI